VDGQLVALSRRGTLAWRTSVVASRAANENRQENTSPWTSTPRLPQRRASNGQHHFIHILNRSRPRDREAKRLTRLNWARTPSPSSRAGRYCFPPRTAMYHLDRLEACCTTIRVSSAAGS